MPSFNFDFEMTPSEKTQLYHFLGSNTDLDREETPAAIKTLFERIQKKFIAEFERVFTALQKSCPDREILDLLAQSPFADKVTQQNAQALCNFFRYSLMNLCLSGAESISHAPNNYDLYLRSKLIQQATSFLTNHLDPHQGTFQINPLDPAKEKRLLDMTYMAFAGTMMNPTDQKPGDSCNRFLPALQHAFAVDTASASSPFGLSAYGEGDFHGSQAWRKKWLSLAAVFSVANVARAVLFPLAYLGESLKLKIADDLPNPKKNGVTKFLAEWIGKPFASLLLLPQTLLNPLANGYIRAVQYAFFPEMQGENRPTWKRVLAGVGSIGIVGLGIACVAFPPLAAAVKVPGLIGGFLSSQFSGAALISVVAATTTAASTALLGVGAALVSGFSKAISKGQALGRRITQALTFTKNASSTGKPTHTDSDAESDQATAGARQHQVLAPDPHLPIAMANPLPTAVTAAQHYHRDLPEPHDSKDAPLAHASGQLGAQPALPPSSRPADATYHTAFLPDFSGGGLDASHPPLPSVTSATHGATAATASPSALPSGLPAASFSATAPTAHKASTHDDMTALDAK